MASDSPPAPAKPESSLRTLASALLDWAFPLMLTAALLLSAAGQYLLTTSKEEDRAILLYAAGVAAFLLAIQTSRRWARRREATAETLGRGNLASRVLMGIGAAILLGASLLMVVNAPSLVLASIFVWGTSLAVAVVTALPVHSPSASPGRRLRLLLSLLSRRETALVGLLVLLGTILRLYDLASLPFWHPRRRGRARPHRPIDPRRKRSGPLRHGLPGRPGPQVLLRSPLPGSLRTGRRRHAALLRRRRRPHPAHLLRLCAEARSGAARRCSPWPC